MGYSEAGPIFLKPCLKKISGLTSPILGKRENIPSKNILDCTMTKPKIPEPKYYNEYTYDHFKEFEYSLDLEKS